ncbi:MAG TPA: PPOX class F420-dependent oxidoreductase [Pseudonocardiaceae bacterium]|jgi:PPOX class probable F420-dependent enzyme|nr:PPOX class F420-dependent oxidoreductase [Pseudonocardiaceae bacterium]
MVEKFDAPTRELLDAKNLAVLTTVTAKGIPNSAMMWFVREGDALLFSTLAHRQRLRNVAANPNVTVLVSPPENPYAYLEVRGTAEVLPDPDQRLPDRLSRRYLGGPPPAESAENTRMIIKVTPDKVINFSVSPE